jgi:hypothetical protein
MHLATSYRQDMLNKIIRDDIYRQFIQITWVNPPGGLHPKMAFYAEHFLELRDGFIVQPHYTLRHWAHALSIPLGQFILSSHRLRVETNHQIDRPNKSVSYAKCRKSRLRSTSFSTALSTMRSRGDFIPYSRGIIPSLASLDILTNFTHTGGLQVPSPHSSASYGPDPIQRINSFTVLPYARGTKRQTNTSTTPDRWKPVGPPPVPRDSNDMTRPDPFTRDG